MIETLQGIIGVVLAFSVAIFVHELGHFMFAKLFGVKVDTFSLGFGKKLLKWQHGETEYCLSAIPFGGYVKMVGTLSKEMEDVLEGNQPATAEEKEDTLTAAQSLEAPASPTPTSGLGTGIQDEVNALRNKAYWKKLLVFSAGCINNMLTAIVIYFLLAWIGYNAAPSPDNTVGELRYVSAAAANLQPNDTIIALGDDEIKDHTDILLWFGNKDKVSDFGSAIPATLVRDGTTITAQLPLVPPIEPPLPEGEIVSIAGEPVEDTREARDRAANMFDRDSTAPVEMAIKLPDGDTTTIRTSPIAATGPWWPAFSIVPNAPARVGLLLPNLPAEKSGLKIGDVIVSINGQEISSSHEATSILRSMPGTVAKVVVERGEKPRDRKLVSIDLEVRPNPENPDIGQIGVLFLGQRTELVKLPFVDAVKYAFTKTGDTIVAYWNALKTILSSSFMTIRENLAGPVGISVQFFKTAQSGWFNFIVTFALFNIVLALTNLLPLPVLDGGHILFATIEAIIRRPLPAKVMIVIYNAFTFLIIGLALLITFNDVIMNSWRVLGK